MNDFINITEKQKKEYNSIVNHPLQSFEWGEFRRATGVKVIRRALLKNEKIVDGFTLTLHKIPGLSSSIGYLPKGNAPTQEVLEEFERIGREQKCVYIQLEPNILRSQFTIHGSQLWPSFHPLFTKYTFILDLTKSEEELLKNMHPKTRYNIRLAQKKGVWVEEDNSEKGFEEYFRLSEDTIKRQGFYAHDKNYHKLLWKTLSHQTVDSKRTTNNRLSYHLFHAKYKDETDRVHTLTSWVLFIFHDTLYYPYGASSTMFREVMASNLMAWEAIRFGKKLGLSKFDMWGALGPNPNTQDPWYGFHRFKEGYGGELVEFAGNFDLVIRPALYQVLKVADKARWAYLKLRTIL